MKYVLLIVGFFLGLIVGGYKSKTATEKRFEKRFHIEEKVYIDVSGCLHTDRHCLTFLGENKKIGAQYVSTKNVQEKDLDKVCPLCTTNEKYYILDSIARKNKSKQKIGW